MRGNRRRDTSPELRLRRELHRRGRRFRVDERVKVEARRCPRPDILFTRWRVAIFVDGCFWHCCPEHGKPPKTNGAYWGPKLARNVERDAEDTAVLQAAGWKVLRTGSTYLWRMRLLRSNGFWTRRLSVRQLQRGPIPVVLNHPQELRRAAAETDERFALAERADLLR